jgi:hypothetical protein
MPSNLRHVPEQVKLLRKPHMPHWLCVLLRCCPSVSGEGYIWLAHRDPASPNWPYLA